MRVLFRLNSQFKFVISITNTYHLLHLLYIEDHISFLGVQYELHNIIPMLDIFALSSLSEGTSVSLLETQSCGIPAVVTDVGGNANIIKDGYNGFLCHVNDYAGMADKIDIMLSDRNLFRQMQNNARSTVIEKCSLHYCINPAAKAHFTSNLFSVNKIEFNYKHAIWR